jgi:hypothetical protein
MFTGALQGCAFCQTVCQQYFVHRRNFNCPMSGVYRVQLPIYAPMIYTTPCIMFSMRAYPLRGEVGGGWDLEFSSFLSPVKCHRADRRLPFRPKILENSWAQPLPLPQVMDLHASKTLCTGQYKS